MDRKILSMRSLLPISLLFLAACAQTPPRPAAATPAAPANHGKVQASLIDAQAADRHVADGDVQYQSPQAWPDNAMPDYPPALLAQRLPPQRVAVRLIVDTQGRVADVQRLAAAEAPAADAFFASVQAAAQQWQFSPLVELRPGPPTELVVGDVSTRYKSKATPLPFHQDYAFRSEQHEGKPAVTTD